MWFKEADNSKPSAQPNAGCPQCTAKAEQTASCSKADQDEIALVQRNDPSCSVNSQLKEMGWEDSLANHVDNGAGIVAKYGVGIVAGFGAGIAAGNGGKCISEMLTTFGASLVKQARDSWRDAKATFENNRTTESNAAQRARLFASLSDAKVDAAKAHPLDTDIDVKNAIHALMSEFVEKLNTSGKDGKSVAGC